MTARTFSRDKTITNSAPNKHNVLGWLYICVIPACSGIKCCIIDNPADKTRTCCQMSDILLIFHPLSPCALFHLPSRETLAWRVWRQSRAGKRQQWTLLAGESFAHSHGLWLWPETGGFTKGEIWPLLNYNLMNQSQSELITMITYWIDEETVGHENIFRISFRIQSFSEL